MLGAGQLDQTIIVKRGTMTQNSSGGFEMTFAPILTTYAKVEEKSLSNDLIAQQPELIGTFEVTIRKRPIQILKEDKIEWNGRDAEILAFPKMQSKEFIKILIKANAEVQPNP